MQRILSYACFALACVLISSCVLNDCGDKVADGKKEGDTIVSRLADVDRYYACEHVETIHHGGSEWEWVWACEDEPRLVTNGGWDPIPPEKIAASRWLRLVSVMESWHELVSGLALLILGAALLIRSLPPTPLESPPPS